MTVERKPKSVEGALYVAVHPNSTPQGGLPALPRFTGMHARECVLIVASWHIARAALRLSAAKKKCGFTPAVTHVIARLAGNALLDLFAQCLQSRHGGTLQKPDTNIYKKPTRYNIKARNINVM